jgi:hypothetical protein
MNNRTVCGLIVVLAVFVPVASFAQTVSQAQIDFLIKQIAALQAQIQVLQKTQATQVTRPTVSNTQNTLVAEQVTSVKFKTGDLIKTTDNLRVRSGASSVSNTNLIGIQTRNSVGRVVGGPISSGNLMWWNVDYTAGPDGWSVENYLVKSNEGSLSIVGNGDTDGNGAINCADITLISRFTVGAVFLSPEQKSRADVNNDGLVTIVDAQQIAKSNNLSCINGDVDGSGVINCADITLISQSTIGLVTLNADQKLRADVSGDGVVNIIDAQQIAKNNNLSCDQAQAPAPLPPPVQLPLPMITLEASPTTIAPGQSSTITLTTADASVCTAVGVPWESGKTFGTAVVSPTQSSVYSFTCSNAQGLSTGRSVAVAVTTPQSQLGDVNLDNFVNIIDAQQVSRHVSGLTVLTGQGLINADVNKDGLVTSADVNLLGQFSAGLITGF